MYLMVWLTDEEDAKMPASMNDAISDQHTLKLVDIQGVPIKCTLFEGSFFKNA